MATFPVGSTAATFSGDVATFPVGSVSATFSGAATFLGMMFPESVATYKIGYIFWKVFLATFPGVATFLVVTGLARVDTRSGDSGWCQ